MHTEPVISVIDGYVAVNGVKTEYEVKTEDIITVVNNYVVVNGVKTEYVANPVVSEIDGYVAVNGVKTEYEIKTEDKITVSDDGYLVVNGVKTEYAVKDFIYNSKSTLYIVYTKADYTTEQIQALTNPLINKGIKLKNYSTNNEEVMPHEIVLGNQGREISDKAYARLALMDKPTEDDGRFLIYSDGTSVAIAYDEDFGDYIRTIAIEYFVENYVASELSLNPGVVYEECINLLDYFGAQDEAYYAAEWKKIEDTLGDDGAEVVAAFKYFYELYDGEKIMRWLMGLYEPSICVCHGLDGKLECEQTKYCGGAGFYYANSSRDTLGFLPDAESCAQALSILGNCGITYDLGGGGYTKVVPKDVLDKLCDYLYNLQEPDGFFYHPQWGTNISDNRRGRDHSWCTSTLKTCGRALKYTNVASYNYRSESALPGILGNSAVSAVSKVISTAGVVLPAHLQSIEAWKAYLDSLDIANNSYVAGNTLSAQSSQIQQAGDAYINELVNRLLTIYNTYNNGTFHHTVNYYAINGVMKLVGQLTGAGVAIPDAELTARACFAAFSSDEQVAHIVDVWNPWVAFNRCLANIEQCTEGGAEKVLEIKESLYKDYAKGIRDTRDKLAFFLKEDGSFSYMIGRTSTTSQGAHVSVAYKNEGDVNSTVIGTNNFTYELFTLVNPKGVGRVAFALSKERYIFYKMINNAVTVQKTGTSSDIGVPLDFDLDELGLAPENVTVTAKASENADGRGASVVADPREGNTGNVMKFVSNKGAGDNFIFNNQGRIDAACQVFEGEFCFENLNGTRLFHIDFGSASDKSNTYRINTRVSGDTITFYETSVMNSSVAYENYLGLSVKKGEWFKLRVEYYVGTHETVRIKIYFNDKLAVISDNYYCWDGSKFTNGTGTPYSSLQAVRMYMLSDCIATILCDNVHCYSTSDMTYKAEQLHKDFAGNINVDADKVN